MQKENKKLVRSALLAFFVIIFGIFAAVRLTGPSAVLEQPYEPNALFVDGGQPAEPQISEDNDLQAAPDRVEVEYYDTPEKAEAPKNTVKETVAPHPESTILLDVPFAAQAPFGGWDDPKQQDGCEEVSVLMAIRWAEGRGLTKQEALEEIIAISDFETAEYGNYIDTSAADTFERIVKGYFKYDKGEVVYDIDKQDLIDTLRAGHVIVIPAQGQMLGNPNFTPPGPDHHMLVVKGYDPTTRQFITNDPGTRMGEGYRYDEDVLFGAIHDYATSGSASTVPISDKVMIVIRK